MLPPEIKENEKTPYFFLTHTKEVFAGLVDRETTKKNLECLAEHAFEKNNASLLWMYIALHDRYVKTFCIPPGKERLPGWQTREKTSPGEIDLRSWTRFHKGVEYDAGEITSVEAALLYALDAYPKSQIETKFRFENQIKASRIQDSWNYPMLVLAPLSNTSLWGRILAANSFSSVWAKTPSKLDMVVCPRQAWQWAYCAQGYVDKSILSVEIARSALDELRFSCSFAREVVQQLENRYLKDYPQEKKVAEVAFLLGASLSAANLPDPHVAALPTMLHVDI